MCVSSSSCLCHSVTVTVPVTARCHRDGVCGGEPGPLVPQCPAVCRRACPGQCVSACVRACHGHRVCGCGCGCASHGGPGPGAMVCRGVPRCVCVTVCAMVLSHAAPAAGPPRTQARTQLARVQVWNRGHGGSTGAGPPAGPGPAGVTVAAPRHRAEPAAARARYRAGLGTVRAGRDS